MRADGKLVVIDLDSAVLRGTVGAGGFKGVVELSEEEVLKGGTPS